MVEERVIKRRKEFISKLFTIWESDIRLEKGIVKWEQVSFNNVSKSVMIAPVDETGRIIFIRKFCPATNSYEVVLPGGKKEDDLSLKKTAEKELIEEIGICSKKLTLLGPLKILPAYFNGITFGFLAEELQEKETEGGDEIERIEKVRIPFRTALQMIKENEITDVRSVAVTLFIATFYPDFL